MRYYQILPTHIINLNTGHKAISIDIPLIGQNNLFSLLLFSNWPLLLQQCPSNCCFQGRHSLHKFVCECPISIADAMQHQLDKGNLAFKGCETTIVFIRMMNDLFDIMNSSKGRGYGLKKPMSNSNSEEVTKVLRNTYNYFKGLQLDAPQTI